MFSSGVVKLSSGDPNWRNLTALTFHYQTQCLPPWTAWYAHQMPIWFHKTSCAVMFAIELCAPFLVLCPRRLRHLGSLALIALQLAIIATGNYGFFNLLTIALCLTWLDDTIWPRRWRAGPRAGPSPKWPAWPVWVMAPLASIIFIVGAVRLGEAFRARIDWPAPIDRLAAATAPLRSINWYGLFSVMTTSRPEVVIEGSQDGADWRAYEFKWKPGEVTRRPPFMSPHMPRLDWEMWFAALGDYREQEWFLPLMARLLEGSPATLELLERNPFPGTPPRYVRASLYDYEFTDPAERLATGAWWRRKLLRSYSPAFSRRDE
jgi:lipase maturation factor 1